MLTASEVLAKRWKAVIMWLLGRDRRRFNELQSHMPGITPKVLTEQLRELERDGLVKRSVIRGGAKHVEYALTSVGETLRPILDQLKDWGQLYLQTRHGNDLIRADAARGQQAAGQGSGAPEPRPHRHQADREAPIVPMSRADERPADRL